MMRIIRTFDPVIIKGLMKDDFNAIAQDGDISFDNWLPDLSYHRIYLISIVDNQPSALFTFVLLNPTLADCHLGVSKKYRNKQSHLLGLAALEWMRANTLVKKFIGFCPEDKPLAKLYAKRCGFKEIAKINNSVSRNGKVLASYIMESD